MPSMFTIDKPGQAGDMDFSGVPADAEVPEDALTKPLKNMPLEVPEVEGAEPAAGGEGATGDAAKLIELAKTQLGVPYVYGAREWGKGLDCSGFTQQAFARIGISIGGDSYTQVTQGQDVGTNLADAKPGDLVFSTGDIGMRRFGHVGIYLGGGMMINAPRTGKNVEIVDITSRSIDAIRRFL